jgi:type II secretory pathway pseudopilin PulG
MGRSRYGAGLTLIEVMVFFAIVSIAMLGALSIYTRHVTGGRLTEQRRLASLAAEEKLDELRGLVDKQVQALNLDPLTPVYNQFATTPPATGLTRCCFNVPNLPSLPGRAAGTVTVINDETPDEAQFGLAYDGTATPPIFGVDINGNRRYTDSAGLPPFPIDLNQNGNTTDHIITSSFSLLPVVITIQWMGPFGRERLDVFTILSPDAGR